MGKRKTVTDLSFQSPHIKNNMIDRQPYSCFDLLTFTEIDILSKFSTAGLQFLFLFKFHFGMKFLFDFNIIKRVKYFLSLLRNIYESKIMIKFYYINI